MNIKRRIEKLEKYRNVEKFKLLIVEKIEDNLYKNIQFETETFTLEELEELQEMHLSEYDKAFMKKRSKAIEKYLFSGNDTQED